MLRSAHAGRALHHLHGLVVTVTAGLPGRLALAANNALDQQQRRHASSRRSPPSSPTTQGNTVDNGTPVSLQRRALRRRRRRSRGASASSASRSPTRAPPCDVTPVRAADRLPVVAAARQRDHLPDLPARTGAAPTCRSRSSPGCITALRAITLPGRVSDLVALANPPSVVVTNTAAGSRRHHGHGARRRRQPGAERADHLRDDGRPVPSRAAADLHHRALTDLNGVATRDADHSGRYAWRRPI